jgi:methyl-accepting chemotaxis protein
VEQVAAAAHALQEQSVQLENAVSRFKIAPAPADNRTPRLMVPS